jgi:hypothetical protein
MKQAAPGGYSRPGLSVARTTGARRWIALSIAALLIGACTRPAAVRSTWLKPDPGDAGLNGAPPGSPEAALRTIAAVMSTGLGIPLPPEFAVLVYPGWAEYAQGLGTVGGMPADRAADVAAYSVGLGQAGRIFINWGALRGTPRAVRLAILTHELTHVAQYELSGGRRGASEQWLREGMADWVACQVLERLGESTFARERDQALRAVARALPVLRSHPLDLVDLGRPLGWEARHLRLGDGPTYRLAFLLTDELIRREGLPALLGYFRAFATSSDRFGNFRQAFGVSLDAFEVDALARVRRELAGLAGLADPTEGAPPVQSSR